MTLTNTAPIPRTRAAREAWYTSAVEEHLAAGTTVADAARAMEVTPVTFYRWKKRLSSPEAAQPRLVRVQVAEPVQESPAPCEAESFTLHLPEDRAIVIPFGFRASDLLRLLEVVRVC